MKANPVTLPTKREKEARRRRLRAEPEMKELARMIRAGELDADRTARHARAEAEKEGQA
jgi:hypothetical protein